MFNYGGMFKRLTAPITSVLWVVLKGILVSVLSALILFALGFFLFYRVNPFRITAEKLRSLKVRMKWYDLFRWILVDFLERKFRKMEFGEYGFSFFVGRQGAGKTTSMVQYLDRMKKKYPGCMIVTNFGYIHSDVIMKSWRDLMEIRNGTAGVIFAIDEIHSEYSSANWKDVPESLLSEISQQRKQRVKIVATAQYFGRIAKPLREQAFSVIACRCFLKRLVFCREYDSIDYTMLTENPAEIKKKIRPLRKYSYVMSDILRSEFDTYEKIERMRKVDFIPRDQRGESV